MIGGFYEFGWQSTSDDFKGPNAADAFTYGDSELYIDFENTADNGLTYGVQLDIEIVDGASHVGYENGGSGQGKGDAKGFIRDNTDEASIYIMGDFGEIHLGHDDNAFGRFQVTAPTHEGSFSQDDAPAAMFLNDNGSMTKEHGRLKTNLYHTTAGRGDSYEDDAKIAYISPSFNGFKFGASTQDDDDAADNPTAFGVSYTGDVGPGALTVKAATETNNADGAEKESTTHFGVKYAMGAFSVTATRTKGKDGDDEVEATEFGVGFKVSDVLSIGVSSNNSEYEPGAASVTAAAATDATHAQQVAGDKQEGTFRSVSGSYTIAPGLKTTVAMNQFDVEREGVVESKNDGSSIVWQIEMNF